MKVWRHGYIWFIVLVGSLALLSFSFNLGTKAPLVTPWLYDKSLPPLVSISPKTDWVDIGLKISAGLGGLMTLTNLIEKFIKIFRRKPA